MWTLSLSFRGMVLPQPGQPPGLLPWTLRHSFDARWCLSMLYRVDSIFEQYSHVDAILCFKAALFNASQVGIFPIVWELFHAIREYSHPAGVVEKSLDWEVRAYEGRSAGRR